MNSEIAKAAAQAYLKEIDGDAFGTPEGHCIENLVQVIEQALKKAEEQRSVTKRHWQVEVENPGEERYLVGSWHDSLDSAVYYRDKCLEPRRGKPSKGFSRRVKFRIYRIETVQEEEKV